MPAEIANKDVFQTINDSTVKGLRDRFGKPEDNPRLTAQVAVALMQLSLLYFAMTAAPKPVVKDFFEKLLDDEDPTQPKREITQDGNRLILPGQSGFLPPRRR